MNLVLPKCKAHPDARALTPCPVCGNTVCAECVRLHGYFCSEACKASYSQGSSADAAVKPAASAQEFKRLEKRLGFWFKRVPLALLALLVVYIGLRFSDRSGTPRWTVPASPGTAFQDLFYGHDSVYALIEDGQCAAYDAADANRKWTASLAGVYPEKLVAFSDGLLVLGYSGIALLDPANGAIRWQNTLATEPSHRSVREDGIVVVHVDMSGDVAVDTDDEYAERTYRRTLSFLEPHSGDVRWTHDCGDREVDFIDASDALVLSVSHVPVPYRLFPCDKHLKASDQARMECDACEYRPAATPEFEVRALDRITGQRQWGLRLRSDVMNGLHVSGDRVLLLASRTVYALDLSGRKVWSYDLSDSPDRFLPTEDSLVLAPGNGDLVCLNLDDGSERWRESSSGWISTFVEADECLIAVVSRPRQAASARNPDDPAVSAAPPSAEQQLLTEIMGDLGVENFGEPGFLPDNRDSYLVAYDLRNGKSRWERPVDYPDIFVHEDECYVLEHPSGAMSALSGDERTVINAYAVDDGALHWTYDADTYLSDIAAGDGSVFMIASDTPDAGPLPIGVDAGDAATSIRALRGRGFINRLVR